MVTFHLDPTAPDCEVSDSCSFRSHRSLSPGYGNIDKERVHLGRDHSNVVLRFDDSRKGDDGQDSSDDGGCGSDIKIPFLRERSRTGLAEMHIKDLLR